jgi:hypothetical protein
MLSKILKILMALNFMFSKLGTNFRLHPATTAAKFTRKIAENASII